MNSLLNTGLYLRYCFFNTRVINIHSIILNSLLMALLICCRFAHASETIDTQIKLYHLCKHPYTPVSVNFDAYKKDEIVFTTRDPNFAMLGNAQYKGIPLHKLLSKSPCIVKPGNLKFTILANDQYVLYDALGKSGAILSYELNSEIIPLKYGGPLKILYRTFPSQEASIWHATSIVLGTLEKPSLRIITENGKAISYDIDHLKGLKSKVENIPLMLPRGYRIEKCFQKKVNVRYLPFLQIFKEGVTNKPSVTIETYSGHKFEVGNKKSLEQLYLIVQLNDNNIPIQCGGPFILAFKNKRSYLFADKQPYYFVHTIRIKKDSTGP